MSIIQKVLVDDFLVNDDTTGGAWQGNASIAMSGSGNYVMVWEDERNGNADIYFQRNDASGVRQGQNQQANDDTGIARQHLPSVAMDASGNFVLAWVDYRSFDGNPDIYFQRYNSSGVRQGNNQQANEEAARVSSANRFSAIAMDGSGNFVIAWVDERNGSNNPDIYFQQYNSSGVKQGNNQKANDDAGNAWQYYPAIAMDGNGNFVIAWQSDGIYFQRYNTSGAKQGNNRKANEVAGEAWSNPPSLEMDGGGNFVIAWNNYYNGKFDLYFQRYDSSGARQGNNQRVNNDAGSSRLYEPSIAMNDSGNITIAWQSEKIGRRYRYDLYLQRYDANGRHRGNNQRVNEEAESAWMGFQAIAMAGSGNFGIVWSDDREVDHDIYLQRYDVSGARQGGNQRVNDDAGSAWQWFPAIARDEKGNFVITWLDDLHGKADIWFQRYTASGIKTGNNQKANDDTGRVEQYHPAIAVNGTGNFVIAWADRRNAPLYEYEIFDIYFQRYDSTGVWQGNNQIANEGMGNAARGAPVVAIDGSGNFVIAWQDYRNDYGDIYLQRFDSSGRRQGNNKRVNDDLGNDGQYNAAIAMDGSGNFVIVWQDNRNYHGDIYFQRYHSSGLAQGNNQKANDEVESASHGAPAIARDGSGNFVIAWEDHRDGNFDVYFQRYDSSGVKQGNNQRVNDDLGSASQRFPAIAMETNGNFVIVWQDYRYDALIPDIMGQRYYSDGAKRGGNYRIVADGPLKLEERPVVTANSRQMVFAWMDYRRPAKGSDIFAKITTWDWEGVTAVDDQQQIPANFDLFQNYPNPFSQIPRFAGNPSTTIEFTLPQASLVTLKIYDLLGHEVATLVEEKLPAGKHRRVWQPKGLASGVYVYRLEAGDPSTSLPRAESPSRGSGQGFVQTKKLILLR